MKKIIILFISIFSFLNSFAQKGWQDVSAGVRGNSAGVYAMCVDTVNNLLYVGGSFDSAGSISAQNIAEWNGTNWDALGSGYGGQVSSLAMYQGNLYVASSSGKYIWYWNGSSWKYILQPFDGGVNVLYVFNDTLYVGGSFTKSGSTILNCIAKWDGTDWKPLGEGFSGYGSPSVNSLFAWNNKLYAAGFFDISGNGHDIYDIARWDDTIWSGLEKGIRDTDFVTHDSTDAPVYALDTFLNKLYIGGDYEFAGGYFANGLSQWNDTTLDSVQSAYSGGTVECLLTYGQKLYLGGFLPGGITSWNGGNIYGTVDTGVNSVVYTMQIFGNKLYVGGSFDSAGHIAANYIARWSPDSTTTGVKLVDYNQHFTIYPNPALNQLTFISSRAIVGIEIENVLGQTIFEQTFASGFQKQTINVNKIPQGIYFYRITNTNSQLFTGKFVKE